MKKLDFHGKAAFLRKRVEFLRKSYFLRPGGQRGLPGWLAAQLAARPAGWPFRTYVNFVRHVYRAAVIVDFHAFQTNIIKLYLHRVILNNLYLYNAEIDEYDKKNNSETICNKENEFCNGIIAKLIKFAENQKKRY